MRIISFASFIFSVILSSCSFRPKTIHIVPHAWLPGDSHRLLVNIVQNGTEGDSIIGERGRRYEVGLTVVDTTNGITLDWQEYFKNVETGEYSEPLTHLVYRITTSGRYTELLNYAEIQAFADTMSTIYLRGAGADSAMAMAIKTTMLDSSILVHNVTSQVRLFHALYGARFTLSNGTDSASWGGVNLFDPVPMHCVLNANELCDSDDDLVSIVAWDDPRRVSSDMASTLFGGILLPNDSVGGAIVESVGHMSISESLDMCFLASKGIPKHLKSLTTSNSPLGTFTRVIYIDLMDD